MHPENPTDFVSFSFTDVLCKNCLHVWLLVCVDDAGMFSNICLDVWLPFVCVVNCIVSFLSEGECLPRKFLVFTFRLEIIQCYVIRVDHWLSHPLYVSMYFYLAFLLHVYTYFCLHLYVCFMCSLLSVSSVCLHLLLCLVVSVPLNVTHSCLRPSVCLHVFLCAPCSLHSACNTVCPSFCFFSCTSACVRSQPVLLPASLE